uniref:Hepatic nuclear factor 4, beta n=1 Tax=Myripristis murdjan TaxID=586833 RepID=A0A667WXZ4_9TELE
MNTVYTSIVSEPTSPLSQPDGRRSLCSICADRATGKHYGASSCDSCKGFFRRSVRSSYAYTCRFGRRCVVDKNKRNQCRHCRLQKCFRAGMRKKAVQSERCHSNHRVEGQGAGTLSISVLLQAEATVHRFPTPVSPVSCDISTKKTACVGDVFESMKQQLLLLVEWAKLIPEFCSLPLDDRVALLRAHSAEHLILGAPNISEMNGLIYDCGPGNDFVIPLRGAEIEMSRVAFQIQDELVKPLREMDITNKEFVCLRAIVFFAPGQAVCKSVTFNKLLFLFSPCSSSMIPDKNRTSPGFFNFMFLSWASLFVLLGTCMLVWVVW